ncbi:MAG: transposase [Candidatus Thiodiazotropha taylori]|uniref:Transposase n=1 Tax=Candidatus Thiodiazotropha taylori TaxID=2792791 RepID=A0A9E4KE29_9GAMM|nr:transposase [Candidatus Thiodiazotropha taylori]MCG8094189.1 transposase [Candidatus Thiodiazotropha endolucinida]MCG7968324.1 transposase [Candidatus Thiodiazotropha taylori]MCG8028101.1 transposase [Candidatus Thiodiazotropha taylori]MCG8107550.1 transposase [Candidatus Thiodiazotropha taylori]
MPRKPRFYLPGVPVHIVQRGHSRDPVFFETQDYATYAHWVRVGSEKYNIAVHAFVLMTNHIHLLITPTQAQNISLFMQFIGRHYVPYVNHKYGQSGSIWEGRYKASLVQEETYFLTVMLYIELNPVRAGMVDLPGDYRWSSFCHNAGDRQIRFITPHPIYHALGSSNQERTIAYQKLFERHIIKDDIKRIRESWQSGTPLGNHLFRDKIEQQLQCKVGIARRGRPTKSKNTD